MAANRQTIVNSDPILDFGEVARSLTPRLRSCLSTPLLSDDTLVGVLTLYSSTPDGFSDDHRRVIESVAAQIAHGVKAAVLFENASRRDQVTGLLTARQLEALFGAELPKRPLSTETSVLLVHSVGLAKINDEFGHDAGDDVLRNVAARVSSALRVADLLFRVRRQRFRRRSNGNGSANSREESRSELSRLYLRPL